ncbi:MAG TPA: LysM peptidoglycan-binding domain-containing protein, partial [Anaeromyxobacteraceae bacterium]|nr:LysM peptidoglycan-binding domain-containing protein [Anaeromyxobacteraceae bacterium]
ATAHAAQEARLAGALERAEAGAAAAVRASGQAEARAAALDAELQAIRWERDQIEQRLLAAGDAGAGARAAAEEATRLRGELEARTAELARRDAELEARQGELRARGTELERVRRESAERDGATTQRIDQERRELAARLADREERLGRLEQELAGAEDRARRAEAQAAAPRPGPDPASLRRWRLAAGLCAAAAVLLALGLLLRPRAPGAAPAAGRGGEVVHAAVLPAAPAAPVPCVPATPPETLSTPAPPSPLLVATAHPADEVAACECPAISYRVRSGDRLWDISARYYQDPRQWRRVYRENRDKVADPDVIFPGQRLRIPARGR